MGWFDRFKKKTPETDLTRDLVLSKLKVGYFVDYELDSYEVTAHHVYDLGDEMEMEEWALNSGRKTLYLSRYEDDEVEWSLAKKIPIGAIDGNMRDYIQTHDDPPDRITYQDTTYYLDDSDAGYFYENGKGKGEEFLSWTFLDESGDNIVTIEQWDEDAFEASSGHYVQEYQFTHILPGRGSGS